MTGLNTIKARSLLSTLVAFLITAAGGAIAGCSAGSILALDHAQRLLHRYAMDRSVASDRYPAEANSILAQMNTSTDAFCSDSDLANLRKTVLASTYIKDVGHMRGDQIACSAAFGRDQLPTERFLPAFSGQDGLIYNTISFLQVGAQVPLVIRIKDSYAALDPSTRGHTPVGMHFTIDMRNGPPTHTSYLGGIRSLLPEVLLTRSNDGRQGDVLYSTYCSQLTLACVTGQESLYRAIWDQHQQLAVWTALGAAAGVCFILILDSGNREMLLRRVTSDRNRLEKRAHDAARAEERNELAHELHDVLAGSFTGILMQIQAASDLAYSEEIRRMACLARAEDVARSGLQQLREFVYTLTIRYDDQNPIQEIRSLVTVMTEGTSAIGTFTVQGIERPLKKLCAHALLRITQEALANAQRYAGSGTIDVHLRFSDQTVSLTVTDDGKGFIFDRNGDVGFGISGMRSRTVRLGGHFEIESSPGVGTFVFVQLPMPYEEASNNEQSG